MASITKNKLMLELTNHGIQLPPPGYKKEDLQRLYNEHVKPVSDLREFSDDDEVDSPTPPSAISFSSNDSPTSAVGSMTAEDAEEMINQLPDKDIYDMLIELHQTIGPVVDTTRVVYKHLLKSLLTGEKRISVVQDVTINGSSQEVTENGDEFSDSDREIETTSNSVLGKSNSEFEDYFHSFVDSRSHQIDSEGDGERNKINHSFRLSKPREAAASTPLSTFAAGDTPVGFTKQRTYLSSEAKTSTTYRRTPTPNPQLAINRNVAPRTIEFDSEPDSTYLKRKPMKKMDIGQGLAWNGSQVKAKSHHLSLTQTTGWILFFLAFVCVALIFYYSNGEPEIDEVDAEIDQLLNSLD